MSISDTGMLLRSGGEQGDKHCHGGQRGRGSFSRESGGLEEIALVVIEKLESQFCPAG